jgi:hypothetical protein
MAAPLVVAVVHLIVRLEILAFQVKSEPPRGVAAFGCGPQAALCTVSGEYPTVGKPTIFQAPDTATKAGSLKQGEESHASKERKF